MGLQVCQSTRGSAWSGAESDRICDGLRVCNDLREQLQGLLGGSGGGSGYSSPVPRRAEAGYGASPMPGSSRELSRGGVSPLPPRRNVHVFLTWA